MEIQIAIAKIDKFASTESGDTVEIIERPNKGISVVLADGKLNGQGSKAISTKIVHKIISQITEGIPDGAAVINTSRLIYREYKGKAKAGLNILSCDMNTDMINITRCSAVPVALYRDGQVNCIVSDVKALGEREEVQPSIYQIPLESETSIIWITDGVYNAGAYLDQSLDFCTTLGSLFEEQEPTAREIAEFMLNQAISLDQGQPADDMSVVVLQTTREARDKIKHIAVRMPI